MKSILDFPSFVLTSRPEAVRILGYRETGLRSELVEAPRTKGLLLDRRLQNKCVFAIANWGCKHGRNKALFHGGRFP